MTSDQSFKRGRTAALTIKDLMNSQRFKLAVEFMGDDPMMMFAILVELCQESARVQKSELIRTYSASHDLDLKEMKPLLMNCEAGNTWNIYWSLSPLEQKLYSLDPKNQKTKEQRLELFEQLKATFLGKL